MKIGIVGNGKMGNSIATLASAQGLEVLWLKGRSDTWASLDSLIPQTDVAIEFSSPESALENNIYLISNNVPTVCGTTGWLQDLPVIKYLVESNNGSFIYASNFSIGVNILFDLNSRLAKLAHLLGEFDTSIEEIHHIHKKDKPSGTALSIADPWIGLQNKYLGWSLTPELLSNHLLIEAIRQDDVFGIHELTLKSNNDLLSIRHEALNRHGFAAGALLAAQWIIDKKGIFQMKDLINELLNSNQE
jgi:4-hydroxy-tetrahydrodipicolinate reductase